MTIALNALQPGQTATVVELHTSNPARLDRLSAYGIAPGNLLQMLQLRPALIFRVGETEISVDDEVARQIMVQAI